jgi:hypothetical protein
LISIVQQRLTRWLDTGGVRLSDGTLIGVANYHGCAQRSEFAGFARYGFATSTAPLPLRRPARAVDGRARAAARLDNRAREREGIRAADLLTGTPAAVVVADKGFWGRDYKQRLAVACGTALLTTDETRIATNLGRERALASTRLVIESVFSLRK